ncbi:MAG: peptidoglycan DD-metalloendopeptidase family protein [Pseudomonadota bacterium]
MRTVVLSNRIRLACQVALVALVAGAGAGCSSDFTRFDNSIYNSTSDLDTNDNYSANPYPEYLDNSTTNSVSSASGSHPVPLSAVSDTQDTGGYVSGNSTYSPYNAPSATGSYGSAPYSSSTTTSSIERSELPGPDTSQAQTRKPGGSDQGGWDAAGGTVITLREGETLYNLSKRYGVPVKEIMKASNVRNASQVQAGQKITIPTYMYSRSAPISAPDNNINTRNARATTGSLIAPEAGRAPLPTRNPNTIAQNRSNSGPYMENGYQANAGSYIVQPGDTLTRIARENGTTVSALIAANQLSGTSVRIGQKLVVPSRTAPIYAGNSQTPAVDRTVTGATDNRTNPRSSGPQPYVKPGSSSQNAKKLASKDTSAPSRTGIGDFRWPARGRVISNFKDKTPTGRNDGIDISVPVGTAVKAVENGVVVYSGDELEGYGNLILIRHTDGWVSAYANNKTLEVERGDEVRRGEIIARSGRTGDATVPKLHFELRKDSAPVDPLKYLGSV